ncbi:MAG: VWA domain-containing protein [Campylobacterales bacterium]
MSWWDGWSFEYPEAFAIFLLYLLCHRFCARRSPAFVFPDAALLARGSLIQWSWLSEAAAVLLLVTAVASPVVVKHHDPRNRIGADIVLALDASRSMSDFGFDESNHSLTKMDILKESSLRLIHNRLHDNIGLVVFGDFAYILAPLTFEKEVLEEMMGDVETGIAGDHTAIGDGLAQAVRLLESSQAKTKIIILVTDGINNRGKASPEAMAKLAASKKIKLYTIGIGKKGDVDEGALTHMAGLGGGKFFLANKRSRLDEVFEEIDQLERSPIKSRDYLIKEYYFQYPLALAVVLLLVPSLSRVLRGVR